MSEVFGNFGVPTFFVTTTVTEPAGGGNVRIWCCVKRNGELTPVCELIVPATDLMRNSIACKDAAQSVFNEVQLTEFELAH